MAANKNKPKKDKIKTIKPKVRLALPPNKRHKSKKDYKRLKIKPHDTNE